MSATKRRFFSGNTIEQALVSAARHFQADPEQIAYRLLPKRHGFVRIQRRVLIEVDPERPLRAEPEPPAPARERAALPVRPAAPPARPAPQTAQERLPAAAALRRAGAEREPASERAPGGEPAATAPPLEPAEGVLPAASGALERILRLAGLALTGDLRLGQDGLEVELDGADRDRLLDDEGELLQAIEYLLPRLVRGAAGEPLPCRVDSGGFRGRREEQLRRLARETGEAVRASGRPVTLDPLSPSERRIIHLALAGDPEVETASEGDGHFKRITIRRSG
jgi:spoIIIJ-associated protein